MAAPSSALKAVRAVLRTVAIAVVAWYGLRLFVILTGITPISVRFADSWVPPTALPQIIQLQVAGEPRLSVLLIPLGVRLLSALALAVEAAAIVIALSATVRLLNEISTGRPFSRRVQSNLRLTAIALTVGSLLAWAVDFWAVIAVVSWWEGYTPALDASGGVGARPPVLPLALLICGLVAGSVRIAFAEGARLTEDAVGVV